jgi:hypothetical protein
VWGVHINRWRVGEDRGSKEMDGCPLTARVEIWGKGIGSWREANVNDVNLMQESMKVINPIREFFFAISVFFISILPWSS